MKKCDTFDFHREQRGKNGLMFCAYSFVCLVVLHLRWQFTCELSY